MSRNSAIYENIIPIKSPYLQQDQSPETRQATGELILQMLEQAIKTIPSGKERNLLLQLLEQYEHAIYSTEPLDYEYINNVYNLIIGLLPDN